jgi:hypothetical protein
MVIGMRGKQKSRMENNRMAGEWLRQTPSGQKLECGFRKFHLKFKRRNSNPRRLRIIFGFYSIKKPGFLIEYSCGSGFGG